MVAEILVGSFETGQAVMFLNWKKGDLDEIQASNFFYNESGEMLEQVAQGRGRSTMPGIIQAEAG